MTGALDLIGTDAATLAKRAADDAICGPRAIVLDQAQRKQLADLVHKEVLRFEKEAGSTVNTVRRKHLNTQAARLRRNIFDRLVD